MSLKKALSSNFGVAGLIALTTIALLSSVLVFHRTTFFTNLDNVDQFYTWYQKLAVSLHHGYLPIWNSNVFSGQSFAGEIQPGVFYPLNILWVALFGSARGISQTALDWLVALHFAIAAFGCYLLLKQLGAQKWAAFLAGITFAFSGVVALRAVSQTNIFFGLALLPYPIYFFVKYHTAIQTKIRWLIASGVALGLVVLSGHVQPFFHAFLAITIIELIYVYKRFAGLGSLWPLGLKATKNLVIVLLAAVAVALPQLWVTARYLPHTYRVQAGGFSAPGQKITYGDFSKPFNVEPHEAANLIDPVTYQIRDGNNLFIGLVPLAIVLLAVLLARNQLKKTKLWAEQSILAKTLLIFSVLAMLGYVTWFAVLLYELPLVYEVRQLGRYSILFHLGLMITLAAALETIASFKFSKPQKRWLAAIGAFLIIDSLYLFLLRAHIFSLHQALQISLVGLTLLGVLLIETTNLRRSLLSAAVILTAALNGLWYLPNIKADTKLPASYSLPAQLVDTLQKTNGQYRVEVVDNAVPVNIGNVYNVQTIGGYDATIYAPYYDFFYKGAYNQDFTRDLLGVKLEITKSPEPGSEIIYSDQSNKIYVVKRPSVLPKMFISDIAGSTNRNDYHPLMVSTLNYDDQYQRYAVTIEKNTQVILSEIAYPGWTLKIDGQNAPLKTYVVGNTPLFKSFNATAGNHTIELIYKPFKVF